ncbi:MAG: tetratricopeptide repeat protein [Myxococcota bacterium]
MHILLLLQSAFSLWMLYDAIKRGAQQYWWIIVLVPFGEIAYFFAVVWPEMRRKGLFEGLFRRPPTVAELRAAHEETPSHRNKTRLAQGLYDAGEIDEAGALFESLLDEEPLDREALYGFAQCALEADQPEAAISALETLVDLDIAYLDSVPAVLLVETYWDADQQDEALALADTLCRKSQRVGPRAVYATYLIELDRHDEARKLLNSGLKSYDASPPYVKRRDREDARAARALLRSL